MAILKSNTLPQDTSINIPNAYFRIEKIYGNRLTMNITVSMYTSKLNSSPDKKLITKSYHFVPNLKNLAPNFIKQGYIYLMSLPEFNGGVSDDDDNPVSDKTENPNS